MYACNVRHDERRPRNACARCYILPPHILDKLASHSDPKVRDAALGTQLATHAFRATRNILGQGFRRSLKTGNLRRTVYDAGNEPELPGRLVRSEGSAAVSDAGWVGSFARTTSIWPLPVCPPGAWVQLVGPQMNGGGK